MIRSHWFKRAWRQLVLALLCCVALPAQAIVIISYHDVRDDVAPSGDPDGFATSTGNFIAHLDWLRAHGYQPVSVQAVLDARAGKRTLPDKAVLLTFDDGLRSVYTRVFPLLKAYNYPALVAPVTSWVDLPAGTQIDYGPRPFTHDDFLTWAQINEMQDSGLVEIGSHSHDLHRGVIGNPFGNQIPAAVTRIWNASSGYESEAAYLARIRSDLETSSARITEHTGKAPRVMVWPYAAYNRPVRKLAESLGMVLSFDLDGRSAEADIDLQGGVASLVENPTVSSLSRLLLIDNPNVRDLADELRRDLTRDGMRAVHVDLDYAYDPDPAQMSRNIDALVQRIKDIGPSHVFLQAFADPDGNGAADSLYFRNRHMPMRADLFSRVSWQLQTRANVRVFAWMPVLGFELPAGKAPLISAGDPKDIPRLDPSDPATEQVITELYEDLAASSPFAGLLFHDDAYLREEEIPQYGNGNPAERTRLLIALTERLKFAAERWRPKLRTVRNLFAEPVLNAEAERWFAQDLDGFLQAYDYTALMAMPRMEQANDPDAWMDRLVSAVAQRPDGLKKTLFELQAVDWRTKQPVPPEELRAQARRLMANGVRHLGYYPEDFTGDLPALPDARRAGSSRSLPYIER